MLSRSLCRYLGSSLSLLLALAPVTEAQNAKPFPEFQAKRVKAPTPGTPPRITVQIEEAPAPQAPLAVSSDETVTGAKEIGGGALGRYGWFWEQVDPGLTAASGPGRVERALSTLHLGQPSVVAPRLQMMQEIAQEHGVPILLASAGTQVSPALVLAVIAVESGGQVDAISGAGAQGLMQLMPDTATRFGVDDALQAKGNIEGGIKYLDWLMGEFDGDPVLALAGYNAGEGSVRNHQGVPPFAETRDYVPKVLAAYQVARGLCMTPPELMSDGCVFRLMN